MAKREYSEAEKTAIILEYRNAVGGGGGGGQLVAKKYGLHAANIIGWENARKEVRPATNGNGHATRKVPRVDPALNPDLVAPGDLLSEFQHSLDGLIAFHEARLEHYRKLREGAEA